MHTPLTDKQERFVLEYLQDHNATAAARRAGYADSTRGSHATALMKMPAIRQRIRAETADLFSRLRLTAFNIMQAQSRAAFFDPRKLFDDQGQPLPINALDAETAGALTVHYDQRPRGNTLRVRQAPRHTALAALERRYGRFLALEMSLVDSRLESAAQEFAQEPEEQAVEEASAAPEATAPASTQGQPAPAHAEAEQPVAASAITSAALSPIPAAQPTPQKPGGAWRHSELLNSLFGTPIKPGNPAAPPRGPQTSHTNPKPVLPR